MKFIPILAAILLAGCVSRGETRIGVYGNLPVASAVTAKTIFRYDEHRNTTKITGPVVVTDDLAESGFFRHQYLLHTTQSSTVGEFSTIQLHVISMLPSWAYLDTAYSEGKQLDLVRVGRRFRTGQFDSDVIEEVIINLTMDDLFELATTDSFTVKIVGSWGHIIIAVPGTYFRGFLGALETRSSST